MSRLVHRAPRPTAYDVSYFAKKISDGCFKLITVISQCHGFLQPHTPPLLSPPNILSCMRCWRTHQIDPGNLDKAWKCLLFMEVGWIIECGQQFLLAMKISMLVVVAVICHVHDRNMPIARDLGRKQLLFWHKRLGDILSLTGRKNIGGSRGTPCQTGHVHAMD